MERERERERLPFSTMGERRKRRSEEDPSSECNDQIFRPKRITAVPPFDVQRAELSRQHVRALNSQFASWVQMQLKEHPDELWQDGVHDYIRHASQILVNFSDVVEWLKTNASSSAQNMTANISKGVIPSIEKNEENKSQLPFQAENESNKSGLALPFTGSWSFGLTAASQSSLTSGLLSQSLVPPISTEGASDDQEDGDNVDEPSSPSVKRTEEPGTVVVHEVKCKLYVKSVVLGIHSKASWFSSLATTFAIRRHASLCARCKFVWRLCAHVYLALLLLASVECFPLVELSLVGFSSLTGQLSFIHWCCLAWHALHQVPDNSADKGWKDMGVGQLSIKCKEEATRGTKEAKATIVIRNDVGKVVLNALLYPNIKLNVQKNTITTIFHTADEPLASEVDGDKKGSAKARLFLMRLKSEDDAKKLEEAINANAPIAE